MGDEEKEEKKKKKRWRHLLTFVVDHSVLVALNGPHELVNLPVGKLLTEGGENYRRGEKKRKKKKKGKGKGKCAFFN